MGLQDNDMTLDAPANAEEVNVSYSVLPREMNPFIANMQRSLP